MANSSRGRPIVPSADARVNKRRQRGRLAQVAYRQRQIDRIEHLEKQLASVRTAVRDVSSATKELDDVLNLSGARPVESADRNIDAVLRARKKIAQCIEDAVNRAEGSGDNGEDLGTATPESSSNGSSSGKEKRAKKGNSRSKASAPEIEPHSPTSPPNKSYPDTTDSMTVSLPKYIPTFLPFHIFLTNAANTFTNMLYWQSLAEAQSLLFEMLITSTSTSTTSAITRGPRAGSVSTAQNMFGFLISHDRPSSMFRRIMLQQRMRDLNAPPDERALSSTMMHHPLGGPASSSSSSAAAAAAATLPNLTDVAQTREQCYEEMHRLHLMVLDDLQRAGESAQGYLDVYQVDEYLRRLAAGAGGGGGSGDGSTIADGKISAAKELERRAYEYAYRRVTSGEKDVQGVGERNVNAVSSTFESGGKDIDPNTSRGLLCRLVRTLAPNCVCFGDGPRFKVDVVRKVIGDVLFNGASGA